MMAFQKGTGDDKIAPRSTGCPLVERITGYQYQAVQSRVQQRRIILHIDDHEAAYRVTIAALRGVHVEYVAAPQIFEKTEMGIAMAADHAQFPGSRQRGSRHQTRPECQRTATASRQHDPVDTQARCAQAGHGMGVRPPPGTMRRPRSQGGVPGVAQEDLRQAGFGGEVYAVARQGDPQRQAQCRARSDGLAPMSHSNTRPSASRASPSASRARQPRPVWGSDPKTCR